MIYLSKKCHFEKVDIQVNANQQLVYGVRLVQKGSFRVDLRSVYFAEIKFFLIVVL